MGKKPTPQTFDSVACANLRNACFKLRGMAYLIERCGGHPCPPLDERDAFYGVSLILDGIHSQVLRVARAMEAREIKSAQRKYGKLRGTSDDENGR